MCDGPSVYHLVLLSHLLAPLPAFPQSRPHTPHQFCVFGHESAFLFNLSLSL
jgi:hypothetical protein